MPHADAPRPAPDPTFERRVRAEVAALGVLLEGLRGETSDREVAVLLPLLFDRVRDGRDVPEDGVLEADEAELRRALRSLVAVLLVASVPQEGLAPRIADDARWALGLYGLTPSMLVVGPDVDEIQRRVDAHVDRIVAELRAERLAARDRELERWLRRPPRRRTRRPRGAPIRLRRRGPPRR